MCGESLSVNDIVIFRHEVVIGPDNLLQEVMKVYRVYQGEQTCHVGFLPSRLSKRKEEFANKTAMIVEDCRTSESASKRQRSARSMGIVRAVLMQHIDMYLNN